MVIQNGLLKLATVAGGLIFAHCAFSQSPVVQEDVHHDVSPPVKNLQSQCPKGSATPHEAVKPRPLPLPKEYKKEEKQDPSNKSKDNAKNNSQKK